MLKMLELSREQDLPLLGGDDPGGGVHPAPDAQRHSRVGEVHLPGEDQLGAGEGRLSDQAGAGHGLQPADQPLDQDPHHQGQLRPGRSEELNSFLTQIKLY